MPDKVKVRVTMWPDRDHEVPEDQVPVLRRQGLLIEDQPADSKPATAGRASGSRNGAQASAAGGDGGA